MEDKSKDFKMKKFNLKNKIALITGASGFWAMNMLKHF